MMGYQTPNIDRIANEGMLLQIIMDSKVVRQVVQPLYWAKVFFAQV